jgi:hypothetical protein
MLRAASNTIGSANRQVNIVLAAEKEQISSRQGNLFED